MTAPPASPPPPDDLVHNAPLHYLALRGDDASITALLSTGAQPPVSPTSTAPDHAGQTPLHWAASSGHASTVRLLLAAGAQPARRDARGVTPLALAAMRDHIAALHALALAAPAAVRSPDAEGHAPLAWAAHFGRQRAAAYLVSVAGADAAAVDGEGKTPLHRAAAAGSAGVVEVLLRGGADAAARDAHGRAAADCVRDATARAVLTQAARGRLGRLGQYCFFALFHVLAAAGYERYVRYVQLHAPSSTLYNIAFHGLLAAAVVSAHVAAWSSPGYVPTGSGAALSARLDAVAAGELVARTLEPAHYCYACLAPRPPRSRHSRLAGRCVLRYDHTCPFLANDVGAGNHRALVVLAGSAAAAVAAFGAAAGRAVAAEAGARGGVAAVLRERGGLAALCAALAVLGGFAGGLFAAQARLIARNQTTWGEMAVRRAGGAGRNPWDVGAVANVAQFVAMVGPGTRCAAPAAERRSEGKAYEAVGGVAEEVV